MMAESREIPVRVALRCRPLIAQEVRDGCQRCVTCVPNEPQIVVGADKAFTFDYVFPPESLQDEVYSTVVGKLIGNLFEGYNVTVLAYGQTGSGKTFTMGTNYNKSDVSSEAGIIPRAVKDIFAEINARKVEWETSIKISFLEILKEDIYDLLSQTKERETIAIREDIDGEIKVIGLTEVEVSVADRTLELLAQGSQSRTTAATLMNAGSSRSHAVFSLLISQKKLETGDVIRSKFHLVDLAGSERAKKTGAQGERFREGVNINKGLLALGNVISALCDNQHHVPYRDSKLTRLLQDSLGGNSYTVMIACVSPADSSMEETVNTMRYADRARKIKNKPIVNRGPLDSVEIHRLKELVHSLQQQLFDQQRLGFSSCSIRGDGQQGTDVLQENERLDKENKQLKKELQTAVERATGLCERNMQLEISLDKLLQGVEQVKEKAQLVEKEFGQFTPMATDLQCDSNYQQIVQNLLTCIKNLEGEEEHKEFATSAYAVHDAVDVDFNLEDTLRKMAFVKEWEELERSLAQKEELAIKMKLSDSELALVVKKEQYERELKQLEEEVSALQKEKDDLQSALRSVKTNANASKVSEQRRKRLLELEAQLAQTRKKMTEQSRMLRMKEEAEKKVNALQEEIKMMKQQRVKLMRQMKAENERHKQIKMQKEKELAVLRQQERRHHFQMVKLERQFSKQRSVMQRKMEEAMAANRRLQNALQQKTAVAERRAQEKELSQQGIGAHVEHWLSQEFALAVSHKEAKYHLQILLDDRKALSEELHNLKNQRKARKRSANGESVSSDSSLDEGSPVKHRIEVLEQEIRFQNAQIQDLQQKILDVDQDEKSKHRWDALHSMLEVKCALQWLFDQATAYQLNLYKADATTKERLATIEEQTAIIEKLQQDIEAIQESHREVVASLVQQQEDKMIFLLKQMQSTSGNLLSDANSDISERVKFQEEEINRLSHIYDDLVKKNEECEMLKKELQELKSQQQQRRRIKVSSKKRVEEEEVANEPVISDDDDDGDDDNDKDPDWQRTPLAKKAKAGKKKSSLTLGCRCQGNCLQKMCGCQKNWRTCSSECKCSKKKCLNRKGSQKENSDSNSGFSLNATFSKDERQTEDFGQEDMVFQPKKPFQPLSKDATDKDSRGDGEDEEDGVAEKRMKKNHHLSRSGLMKKFYSHNASFFSPVM